MVADGSINIGAWIGVSVGFIVFMIMIVGIARFFIRSTNSYDDNKPKKSGMIRCSVCGAVNIRHNCVDKAWRILTAPNLKDVVLKQEAEEQKIMATQTKQQQEKQLEKELGTADYRQLKAIRHIMPEYLRGLDNQKRDEEKRNAAPHSREEVADRTDAELRKHLAWEELKKAKIKRASIGMERASIYNECYRYTVRDIRHTAGKNLMAEQLKKLDRDEMQLIRNYPDLLKKEEDEKEAEDDNNDDNYNGYEGLEEEIREYDREYEQLMSKPNMSHTDWEIAHECFRTARDLEDVLAHREW